MAEDSSKTSVAYERRAEAPSASSAGPARGAEDAHAEGAPAQQRSRKQSQNRKPKPKPSSSRPNQSPRCMLAQAVYIPSNPESCMSKATVLANANLLEISGFEHKLRLNGVTLLLQLACTETLHACRVGLVETAHGPGPRPYRQRWLAAWKARRLQFGKLEPRCRLGISL